MRADRNEVADSHVNLKELYVEETGACGVAVRCTLYRPGRGHGPARLCTVQLGRIRITHVQAVSRIATPAADLHATSRGSKFLKAAFFKLYTHDGESWMKVFHIQRIRDDDCLYNSKI